MRDAKRTWGPLQVVGHIWKNEGIKGLYRGLGPSVAGLLPNWAIYFTTYETLKPKVQHTLGLERTSSLVHLTSAISAGLVSATGTNPVWVVKVRMMTQKRGKDLAYKNSFDCVAKIIRHEGILGLYKGLGTSMLGVIHVGIQFPLYEALKIYIAKRNNHNPHNLPPTELIAAASGSKVVASVAWYPHEVIRTRLQNQTAVPPKYVGIFSTLRLIVREEGILAMYAGMGANLVRVVPAGAITFTIYEVLSRNLGRYCT
eukprot:Nk52_evm51s32 gene=Nk52_evmTU51s32